MPTAEISQLIRCFLDGISQGVVAEELLTPDMTFWSISSGEADKQKFLGGIQLLSLAANGSIRYKIISLTAEEDRVIAEVTSNGTLMNGETISNNHIFLFRLENGKISTCSEYMNQMVVKEKILPLMQALATKASQQQ